MAGVGLERDRYHRYSFNGDGPLVGVTTPLKIQDVLIGGDLASWGGGIAFEFAIAHPDATRDQALAQVGLARDLGSAVHARIEHILLGEPTPNLSMPELPCPRHPSEFGRRRACGMHPELVQPYLDAFSSFLAERRPEFLLVEFMVANLKHRYGGTGDIACLLDGRRSLIDVKTGKSKVSHRLQLAGLAAGEFVGRPDDATQYPLPKFQDFYTLLLSPAGFELVQHHVTAADRRHFFTLVRTYRALRAWEAS